jgi:acetolactate synthase small subunit
MHIKQELTERHVLTLTVDNEAGTLARIAVCLPRAVTTSTV